MSYTLFCTLFFLEYNQPTYIIHFLIVLNEDDPVPTHKLLNSSFRLANWEFSFWLTNLFELS
jgi:hypothetical protein